MARVPCVCGQLITPNLINGEPRTKCPFCHRALAFDSMGHVVGGQAEKPAFTPREVAAPKKPVTALYPTSPAAQGSPTRGALAAAIQRHTPVQSAPRYVHLGELQASILRLRAFVESLQIIGGAKRRCPYQRDCPVASCHRAFACGVLPRVSSGPFYIALWTFVPALAMLAALTLLIVILESSRKPGGNLPNWNAGIAMCATYVAAAGLIGFVYASVLSHGRQKHVRGIAGAAERHGLQFWPLVEVPPYVVPAFPLVCPPPATTIFGKIDVLPTARLAAAGKLQGHEVFLAQYHNTFDPRDHQPMGNFFKVAQAIARPATALHNQRVTRLYLVAYFPEPLLDAPDLLLTRERRDVECWYLKRNFTHNIVAPLDANTHFIFASIDAAAGQVCAPLVDLLKDSPGYSIQVVGARLLVWKGNTSPWLAYRLPTEADTEELLAFASQVRGVLAKHAAAR